jgi:hypothetical protein
MKVNIVENSYVGMHICEFIIRSREYLYVKIISAGLIFILIVNLEFVFKPGFEQDAGLLSKMKWKSGSTVFFRRIDIGQYTTFRRYNLSAFIFINKPVNSNIITFGV